jgi:ankyrin repeat protein
MDIHHAETEDLDVVIKRLKETLRDEEQKYAEYQASRVAFQQESIVESIVAAEQEAEAELIDISSWNDLNVAFEDGEQINVIRFVVKRHPRVLEAKNERGWRPLHMAIAYHVSFDVVQFLVEANPDTVAMTTASGLTALHVALIQNSPLNVIRLLVDAWPATLMMVRDDESKATPLHVACMNSANLEVIRLLLTPFPEALIPRDSDDDTPLHCACDREDISIGVLQYLIAAWPNALLLLNSDGLCPLHVALGREAPADVIRLLLDECPSTVMMVIEQSKATPLHVACDNTAPLEVIRLLVQRFPEALKMRDSDDETPLHRACEEKASLGVLEYLINECPIALLLLNSEGNGPDLEREDIEEALNLGEAQYAAVSALFDAIRNVKTDTPPDVITHVKGISETDSPYHKFKNSLRNQVWFENTLRYQVWQDSLKCSVNYKFKKLLSNEALQSLLNDDKYQCLVLGIFRMNETGRQVLSEPENKVQAISVLSSVTDFPDCLFLNLRENPLICKSEGGEELTTPTEHRSKQRRIDESSRQEKTRY